MRLSPSPPSITGSTPPPQGGIHGGTPPSMATYARVSNLKKVINNGGMGHNNGGMGHNNGGIVQQNPQSTSQAQGNITSYLTIEFHRGKPSVFLLKNSFEKFAKIPLICI